MNIFCKVFPLLLLAPVLAQAAATPRFDDIGKLPDSGGTLIIPIVEGQGVPKELAAGRRDQLTQAAALAEFEGEEDQLLELYTIAGYERVVLLGLGKEASHRRALVRFGGRASAVIRGGARLVWPRLEQGPEYPGATVALGLQLGGYRFDKYKTDPAEKQSADSEVVIYSSRSEENRAHWENELRPIAEGVVFARDLINEPANIVYPESFVNRAKTAFRGLDNIGIKVLDVRDMEELNMGAILGVGMGSARPPRLLIVEYSGGKKSEAPLAFVGKGVTFDAGGISLKSSKQMWRMKYDMSGAAAVTGALLTLAKRQAPVNAVAVAALVENMPSQKAQRPGDIRTTMSGKTVEVINTDAEGRLILADAVWYAREKYHPAVTIDLATLTGSIVNALADTYAGLFSRHDELAGQIKAAGTAAGEEVWRMPLHASFVEMIKSDIADVKNAVEDGYGGASTGAEFIGTFVPEDTVWAHLDIAGKAWELEGKPAYPKGAAGWGVRLLNQWVRDYYEKN